MIRSYRGESAPLRHSGRHAPRFPAELARLAERKLRMLDAARTLDDLRIPPANRLEALRGDRAGAHSIRINDKWRICFVWKEGDADEVEVVDDH